MDYWQRVTKYIQHFFEPHKEIAMRKTDFFLILPLALFVPGCTSFTNNGSWSYSNDIGTVASSNSASIEGSGKVKSETRKAKGFTSLSLTGMGRVILEQTGKDSLSVSTDDNLLPYLTSEVKNGKLTLGIKNNTSFNTHNEITYKVTVRNLKELDISGSGDIDAKKIKTDKLQVVVSGSGTVTLQGEASSQEINVSGSGSFDGEKLKCKTAKIDIAGSGNGVVNTSEKLDANISGSGSVEYLGNPTLTQDVSGSGSITKK